MILRMFLAAICLLSAIGLYAEEDEAAMFDSTNSMVSLSNVQNQTIGSNMDKESVTMTGTIYTSTSYAMNKYWLAGSVGSVSNQINSYIQGNIFLDVRLTKGIKAFANIAAVYTPEGQPVQNSMQMPNSTGFTNLTYYQTNQTILNLQEFFVDANWNKDIYFRGGKQVLQWGTCYLWNVSDMVNVMPKSYYNLNAYRDGSYGLKIHVPVGSSLNFYTWYDANNLQYPEKGAIVGKAEFLLGGTEFSFSSWAKQDSHPIFAGDFSTRLFGIDFRGEARLSDWDSLYRVETVTNVVTITQVTNQLNPKVVLGFTKQFDIEEQNRLTIIGEFYYNSAGYSYNVFADDARRAVLLSPLINAYTPTYTPYYTSMFYGALFGSFIDFIVPDLTLNLNAMMNLVDTTAVISPGLSYNPVNNFTFGLTVNWFVGPDNGEFTFLKQPLQVQFTTTMNF